MMWQAFFESECKYEEFSWQNKKVLEHNCLGEVRILGVLVHLSIYTGTRHIMVLSKFWKFKTSTIRAYKIFRASILTRNHSSIMLLNALLYQTISRLDTIQHDLSHCATTATWNNQSKIIRTQIKPWMLLFQVFNLINISRDISQLVDWNKVINRQKSQLQN